MESSTPVALSAPAARWLITAAVLGSGIAFLDGTVVVVALPAIGRELGGGISMQQWVLNGYLLTLGALLLLGGALGDRYGRRRVFLAGLVVFTLASLACGLAPDGAALIGARVLQGVGAAALVPGSLALINVGIVAADRGRAVGLWAGMSGVTSALGPFLGGWLVDAVSWRWVFFLNVPIAVAAFFITMRHVGESGDPAAAQTRTDFAGATAVMIGLAGVTYALIEVPAAGWRPLTVVAAVLGVAGLIVFPVVESRLRAPLLPLGLFRSPQFTGANLVTLAVYGALGGALFLLAVHLQQSLGYSALATGLATLPITIIMLLASPRVGALMQVTGPRPLMTVGPLVAGAGLALMARITPGASYLTEVLPGVVVFGIGLSITVAPLTATVLAAVPDNHVGAASGANNAVSRIAGLVAVAVLPVAAGIDAGAGEPLGPGFARAMLIAAGLCVAGGLVALATIRQAAPVRRHVVPGVNHACQHPCTRDHAIQSGSEASHG